MITRLWFAVICCTVTLRTVSTSTSRPCQQKLELTNSNPMKNPKDCGFLKPSYTCDPDHMLDDDQAENLNFLASDLRWSTACICSHCPPGKNGVTIGIFIKYNLTNPSCISSNGTLMSDITAKSLRQLWHMGTCEDDIVILVVVQPRKFEYSMGASVSHLIHRSVAEQIFKACTVHFENDNFYQGLESMINSYHDILRRLQYPKPNPRSTKTLGLVVGLSMGIVVFLVLMVVAFVLRYRQLSKPPLSTQNSHYSRNENVESNSRFEYRLCGDREDDKMDNLSNASGGSCSSSDEGIDSDEDKGYNPSRLDVPRYLDAARLRRQLSDVVEENEEESEVINLVTMNPYTAHNEQITEL